MQLSILFQLKRKFNIPLSHDQVTVRLKDTIQIIHVHRKQSSHNELIIEILNLTIYLNNHCYRNEFNKSLKEQKKVKSTTCIIESIKFTQLLHKIEGTTKHNKYRSKLFRSSCFFFLLVRYRINTDCFFAKKNYKV